MTDRRVVITGLGVITPIGNDVETFWSNLKNGVSGIHKIEAFDTAGLRLQNRRAKFAVSIRRHSSKIPRMSAAQIDLRSLRWGRQKSRCEDSGIDVDEAEGSRPLRRHRQQWNRRPKNTSGSADDPADERALADFAIHDSDADQQYGQRRHLDGVRPARTQHVYRHRLRDIE